MSRLRIAEIFTSIQGEGIWTGVPSTFVRISGCNMRCRWCDTPYASWEPEGEMWEIDQILAEVRADHVVLTGGEPMLFDPIEDLARRLKEAGKTITIETAGTVYRQVACDLMSISPKLANSDPDEDTPGGWAQRHRATREDREPLKRLVQEYSHQLKFVVNPDEGLGDLDEIEALIAELPAVRPDRILLMPEGTDAETLHRRMKRLVDPVLERGWRLTPRLHIDLFGDTRGT